LINEEVRIKYQGSTAEVTVEQQPNQNERKKSAVYLFFLDFSLLLSLHQGKESRENTRHVCTRLD